MTQDNPKTFVIDRGHNQSVYTEEGLKQWQSEQSPQQQPEPQKTPEQPQKS
jgi:hypothetical protein